MIEDSFVRWTIALTVLGFLAIDFLDRSSVFLGFSSFSAIVLGVAFVVVVFIAAVERFWES